VAAYSNPNIPGGSVLPSPVWGQGFMFYLDANSSSEGLYVSDGNHWHKLIFQSDAPADQAASATLVSGTVSVAVPEFDADSHVVVSYQNIVGTPGILSIANEVSGVGFDIVSTSPDDMSKVVYQFQTQAYW
jgi:hypothetical protein